MAGNGPTSGGGAVLEALRQRWRGPGLPIAARLLVALRLSYLLCPSQDPLSGDMDTWSTWPEVCR